MKRTAVIKLLIILFAVLLCSCSAEKKQTENVAVNQDIIKAYKARLVENIYRYDNLKADELPTYALYDLDGDGIPELLIWDIRRATTSFRNIFVYHYNAATGETEHIGTILDFSGHSLITTSANGRGVVVAILDSGRHDRIIRYSLINGVLTPTILAERTDETSQAWYNVTRSPEFNSGLTLETANTYSMLEKEFEKLIKNF